MIIGTEITESLSVLLILYTEELNKKVMQEFLETLSAGRYQDAKKQDPQVLLQILICSSKLEFDYFNQPSVSSARYCK
jgi:hypothetical protein